MKPLTEHDAQRIAKALRIFADDLVAGFTPRGALRRANDWAGNLRGADYEPGGTTGGDPTGEAASSRQPWPNLHATRIAAQANAAYNAACFGHVLILEADSPYTDDEHDQTAAQQVAALANRNRRAGYCDICNHEATGDRDDRLTLMTVDETVWTHGTESTGHEERNVCKACREAWRRAKDRGEDFLTWERNRKLNRERETA